MTQQKILVIGAGVSGLSSAILLKEAGYEVTIRAKELGIKAHIYANVKQVEEILNG